MGGAGFVREAVLRAWRDIAENRIKEQFNLFADRVSTETMRGNQMRLYLSAMWPTSWLADCGGWACKGQHWQKRR